MNGRPIPLLLCGYGLAASIAVGLDALGAPIIVSVSAAWVGGAAITVALAVVPWTRRWFSEDPAAPAAPDQDDVDAALAEALRRWEADRAADRGALADEDRRSA